MDILIGPDGSLCFIYGEAVDLSSVGILKIQRASHVDPTSSGHWQADLSPLAGPILGPFTLRSEALIAETGWLHQRLFGS